MSKIHNRIALPKKIFAQAQKAITRLRSRHGSAHSVKLGESVPLRQTARSSARRRSFGLNLFSRRSRISNSGQVTGRDGRQDGAQLLEIFRAGKPDALLHAVHDTATNPDITQKKALDYNADLYGSFHQELAKMSDADLIKLTRHLNGQKMTKLRQALKFAAQQGAGKGADAAGVKKEFDFTSRHLEGLNRLVLAEAGLRRQLVHDMPSPLLPSGGGNHGQAMNILRRFGRAIAPHISSSSGKVPPPLHARIQNDFVKLARESEAGVPNESIGKEGGISHLNPRDPKSEELNVSEIYIKDFGRCPKIFDDGRKAITNFQLGWGQRNRREISDHITEFCQGNANQARRVSALVTQQSMAGLYKLQRNGELAPHPEIDRQSSLDGFGGSSILDQEIKRQENGDIHIRVKQTLEPFMFNQDSEDGMRSFPVGDKKSSIQLEMDVVVPFEQSAPPQITRFDHSSHIVIEKTLAELP